MDNRETDQQPCRFFKLPGEIRNQIYKLVLTEEQPLTVNFGVASNSRPSQRLWHGTTPQHLWNLPRLSGGSSKNRLSITAVCKEIRAESFEIFLGDNKFKIQFHDHIPDTQDKSILQTFSRYRTLQLRGWLSYLGDFKNNLRKVDIDLGLLKPDFDQAWVIESLNGIKAAFSSLTSTTVTLRAAVTVQSLQTLGKSAMPRLRIATDVRDLDEALKVLEEHAWDIRCWITSRSEIRDGRHTYYAMGWKHDSVRDLERVVKRVEGVWRGLDGDPAWKWDNGRQDGASASSLSRTDR